MVIVIGTNFLPYVIGLGRVRSFATKSAPRTENATPTALGAMSRERFKQELLNFTHLSRTVCLTYMPDITSLTASGRLQNAIKYCLKVRKTGPGGQSVE